MKKPLILVLILIFSSQLALAAPSPSEEAKAPVRSFEDTSLAKSLSMLYIKGLAREKIKAYEDALYAYEVILSKVQGVLAKKNVDKSTAEGILPFAIAAAYRKGIVTHRSIEGSVVKLYSQLKMYEDADKWIKEVFTMISNLELEEGVLIPEKEYGPLYYARAYNKAGWAYAMFNGSYWKRYIIYTPAEVIGIIDKSMEDLQKMYSLYCLDESGAMQDTDKAVSGYVAMLDTYSGEYLALDLCYDAEGPEILSAKMAKHMKLSVKSALDLYNSPKIKNALDYGRRIYTYEDFIKPETKDVIVALSDLLEGMKGK
ncbi:MAG: hypothetical protein NT030_01245 [Candidatus Saganbacteria bacterium]|nr:hypothetical protein [Candidatus Saganbacteria bacterium]